MNKEIMKNEVMENEETRIEKIKKHFRRNRNEYIAAIIGTVIGTVAAATYILKRYGMTEAEMHDVAVNRMVAHIKGSRNTAHLNYTEQTISIYGNKIGRPGIPIWDTTTGKRFESMTLAAESLGVTPNRIWNQVYGRTDHVNGHRFELAE